MIPRAQDQPRPDATPVQRSLPLPGLERQKRSRKPRRWQAYLPEPRLPACNPNLPPAGGYSRNFDEC
jgi:hypothetical protein